MNVKHRKINILKYIFPEFNIKITNKYKPGSQKLNVPPREIMGQPLGRTFEIK